MTLNISSPFKSVELTKNIQNVQNKDKYGEKTNVKQIINY